MSLLFMECPVHCTYFSTGVHVDDKSRSFICDRDLIVANCPNCKVEHSALVKFVRAVEVGNAAA